MINVTTREANVARNSSRMGKLYPHTDLGEMMPLMVSRSAQSFNFCTKIYKTNSIENIHYSKKKDARTIQFPLAEDAELKTLILCPSDI